MKILSALIFCLTARAARDPYANQFSKYEKRVIIAVIDTGLNVTPAIEPFLCSKELHFSPVDGEPLRDLHGHGTNIAGLIAKNLNPKKHCLAIIKFFRLPGTMKDAVDSIRWATIINAKFINLSLIGEDYEEPELHALQDALYYKIKIAVSAGNDRLNLNRRCKLYPVCYNLQNPDFHVVGSNVMDWNGRRYSNYGRIVKFWEPGSNQGEPVMTGTSQSTAIHTGKWASGKLK